MIHEEFDWALRQILTVTSDVSIIFWNWFLSSNKLKHFLEMAN